MPRSLTFPATGFFLGLGLAGFWGLVMIACMLLVGSASSGSLQAAFLAVGWRSIVGFELGLLAATVAGLVLALLLAVLYRLVRLAVPGRSKAAVSSEDSKPLTTRSWRVKGLFLVYVLPALVLVIARAVASADVFTGAGDPLDSEPGHDARTRAMSLGPIINTARREAEPTFTADGRTMYFNCNNADICVSRLTGAWEQGRWSPPEPLDGPINTEYLEVEPVINGAGDKLYFMSIRPQGVLSGFPFLLPLVDVFEVINRVSNSRFNRTFLNGLGLPDVYVSQRINGVWTEPVSLNSVPGEPHVNTPYSDHCLFFSADGNEAFWTSTRPGGLGGDDIWTSRRVNGSWTEAENLGPNVNSPGKEHAPTPTPDGKSLYVTATRAEGLGGEDIYVTKRGPDGQWGPLANLGPLVNGPGDDRCPAWTPDLRIFLFDSVRQGGYGAKDIWWIEFKNVNGYPL